jgi:hypothetical protein
MSSLRRILRDAFAVRMGSSDLLTTYYTCIPVDPKETSYECIQGFLNVQYSPEAYDTKKWRVETVPFYVFKEFHESYLNGKIQDRSLRILKDV